MEVLKSDLENFEGVKGQDGSFCHVVSQRSCFNYVCVQQLVAVCKRLGWTFWESDETREVQWLAARFLIGVSTLFNENAFKYMRVQEPTNKVLSHLRKWTAMVKSPLVSEDFKHTGIDVSLAPEQRRAQKLPTKLFKPLFRDTWEQLRPVASIAKSPTWVTASSDSSSEPYMDILAMRYIASRCDKNWALLEHMWKTSLLNTEHILIRHRDSTTTHLPLGTVGNSGALAIELSEFTVDHAAGAGQRELFQPKTPVEHVTSIHLDNIGEWIGTVFEYRCPQWVFSDRGLASTEDEHMVLMADEKIGICMVPTHDPEPLRSACARQCFGKAQPPFLRRLCGIWDISLRGCDGSLFAILVIMIIAILAPTEEELLDIVLLRLTQVFPSMASLQDEPEVTDVLEPDEVRELDQALEKEHKKRAALDGFSRSYWRRRRAHTAASGSGGAGGHGPAGRRWVPPPPNCHLAQAEVSPLMPPQSAVWRNNGRAHGPYTLAHFTDLSSGVFTGPTVLHVKQCRPHGGFG